MKNEMSVSRGDKMIVLKVENRIEKKRLDFDPASDTSIDWSEIRTATTNHV